MPGVRLWGPAAPFLLMVPQLYRLLTQRGALSSENRRCSSDETTEETETETDTEAETETGTETEIEIKIDI